MKGRGRFPWKVALIVGGMAILLAGVSWVFKWPPILWGTQASPAGETQATAGKTVYICPMHPTYRSDRPGECPICGMTLIPLEPESSSPADHGEHPGATTPSDTTPPGLTTVRIDPRRQQMIGIRTAPVMRKPVRKHIRTVGIVTYDETRLSHIHTKFRGWIERIYVDFTGQFVKKGQPLVDIYSPELVATQEEYLRAIRLVRTLEATGKRELIESAHRLLSSARNRLRFWDIPEAEIATLERTGQVRRTLTIVSPVTGYVVEKKALLGMEVDPKMELYTIADLSVIWVEADIYEYEIPDVHVGMPARLTLAYYPGRTWEGRVDYIYPYLDVTTRTNKVRFTFPNPTGELRPGMYVNVELVIDKGEQLVVPDEAILDTGTLQYVFVNRGEGFFEPRVVEIGEKVDEDRIVLRGLEEGEEIVVSGNFLIDSESRLKAALTGMTGGHGHDH